MTAEVAILNSSGIALAADSAVTIGSEKIYNSALKLFALSKVEPVGIMIYGNASLMGLPWETIIKVFRKELGSKSYKSLKIYADTFVKFLSRRSDFFSDESQRAWFLSNVVGYYKFLFDELVKEVELIIKEKGKITESDTVEILTRIIDRYLNDLKERGVLKNMSLSFEAQLKRKFSGRIKEIRDEVFQGLPLSRSMVLKLNSIAVMLHTRDIFSDSTSGIVIAGYGQDDLFPSVETYEIEGIIEGKAKYKRQESKCKNITNGRECTVVPFAQDDMVASFMNGLSPSIQNFIFGYLNNIFERLPELLDSDKLLGDDKEKGKTLKKYGKDIQILLKEFTDELVKTIQSQHVQPIMQMVGALPKDELAAMAESLVNLTAFKRRMTRTLETVGGPIDVAVISKGDGLVWVKRKHYFPKELNQHFFANYYRGL